MTDAIVVHRSVLPATPPYSFDLSLRALTGFAPCATDHRVADGVLRKAFTLRRADEPDEAVVAEIAEAAGGTPGVALTVHAARPLDAAGRVRVERDVSRWLSLDDDLGGFLAVAKADPAMAPLLAVAAGLHQVRFPALAEGAVYFTLTQRSTQWFAASRKRRFAEEHGPRLTVDDQAYVSFPSLATVAALDDETLGELAGSRHRAARVRTVVAGVAALDEGWLRSCPYDDAKRALLAVPGIGAFTAHAILLRVLGRPNDVPLEVAQFRLAAEALYGDPPPTPAELRERYGRWIGWWAYLARTAQGWPAAAEPESATAATVAGAPATATAPTPAAGHADGPVAGAGTVAGAKDRASGGGERRPRGAWRGTAWLRRAWPRRDAAQDPRNCTEVGASTGWEATTSM
jgi:DNA-3-methyladenine glycosylase II